MFDQDNVEFIVDDNVIKKIGNFQGVIKSTHSTVVDGDGKFSFPSELSPRSDRSTKKSNWFVIGRFVVKVTIEVTDVVLDGGADKAIANFMVKVVDWIFL